MSGTNIVRRVAGSELIGGGRSGAIVSAMLGKFQNHKSLFSSDHARDVINFHRKYYVLDGFGQLSAWEITEVSALGCGRAI
jgi:hypothetical protein